MIQAFTMLLGCQVAGEALARLFAIPVPDPVLGLALLFVGLMLNQRLRPAARAVDETPLGAVAQVILANLSLLFVPAGVGIVRHAGTLLANGIGLVVALVVSTALTLVVTALVFTAMARRFGSQADGDPDPSPEPRLPERRLP